MIVTYGTPFNGGLEKRLPKSLRRRKVHPSAPYTPAYKAQRAKWRAQRPRRVRPARFVPVETIKTSQPG